jgi:hypothetical protein
MMKLRIASSWDGKPLTAAETAEVTCFIENDELTVLVEAPYFGDPPPPGKPGSTDQLWEHEVVELFLLGSQERYLEIELGPHGHYLVLQLHGQRNVTTKGLPIRYETEILGKRWRGAAMVPIAYLPPQLYRANGYAIHGDSERRRYSAAFLVPGPAPDFHRLENFGRIGWPPGINPATPPKRENRP